MATPKKSRKVIPTVSQASLIKVDLDSVWTLFIEKSGWQGTDVEEEKEAIEQKIGAWKAAIEDLKTKIENAEKDLSGIDNREVVAKMYLDDAAKALGNFGSEPVLLAAMYDRFPSAKPKVGRKTGGSRVKLTPDMIQMVQNVLDADGVSMGQIKKALAGKDIEEKAILPALKELEQTNLIARTGERRATKYHLNV